MTSVPSNVFRKSRVYFVLIFALLISSFLMYSTLTKIEFRKVSEGKGSYCVIHPNRKNFSYNNPKNFVLCEKGDYNKVSATAVFSEIQWTKTTIFWLFLSLIAMIGRDFFYIIRIRILTKKQLSVGQGFRVIMLWEFASALAPGVLSGATVAMFILNRERITMGKATAIVITTAFLDNLFFVLVIPLLFFGLSKNMLFSQEGMLYDTAIGIFWIGFFVFALLCLVLYLSLFQFPNLIKSILLFACRLPFLKRWKEKAEKTGIDISNASLELSGQGFLFWIKAFFATMGSWTSRYLVINCILQAFLHLNLFQQLAVLAKQFVMWMFLRISPTPGGSGVAEWAFGELLSEFSSSIILIGGMALIWRLISYYPYLLIGSLILPKWLLKTGGNVKTIED